MRRTRKHSSYVEGGKETEGDLDPYFPWGNSVANAWEGVVEKTKGKQKPLPGNDGRGEILKKGGLKRS